jgi:hypothetical protein
VEVTPEHDSRAGQEAARPATTASLGKHQPRARDILAATRRVRIERAARRLHRLRQILGATGQAAEPGSARTWRIRRAERRACAALTRAGFADPDTAAEILRQAQVLTWTQALARLDYTTPAGARAALGNLITASPVLPPPPAQGTSMILNGSRDLAHPGQRLASDGPPPGLASTATGHRVRTVHPPATMPCHPARRPGPRWRAAPDSRRAVPSDRRPESSAERPSWLGGMR